MIFNTDENIKSHNGIFDSPIEVNMVERMLYINKTESPQIDAQVQYRILHYIRRRLQYAHHPIRTENPKIPRNMLKSKKLINEVDTIVFILP